MKEKRNIYEFVMLILVSLDIFLLAFSMFRSFTPQNRFILSVFDLIVCFILFIEFIYSFAYAKNKKYDLKHNWYYIIAMIPDILLSSILSFLGLNSFTFVFRLVGVVRIGRLLILLRNNLKNLSNFIKYTFLDVLIIILIILTIFGSITFYFVDTSVTTYFDSLWYVVVTISSLGYGDIVPETFLGRIIGFILIIGGICIYSVLIASVSSYYTRKLEKETRHSFNKRFNNLENKVEETHRILKKIEKLSLLDSEKSNKKNNIENKKSNIENKKNNIKNSMNSKHNSTDRN
ncbi:potassium channel family protein [Methanobrevibacter curvatus]|uniref:pH-gated potassium channel KcsA n=1 Tax=Methanobrevibacter curvatus TaxID=49547 RepID=A0A166C667_9EURY|nr:potassium channel family protein [Methanobrevibacter curvatus]KZX11567.1 pH-gated potassium channel KcsA [Methanobrevibacter curvatus]